MFNLCLENIDISGYCVIFKQLGQKQQCKVEHTTEKYKLNII